MPIGLVQQAVVSDAGGLAVVSLGVPVTAGNSVIVVVSYNGAAAPDRTLFESAVMSSAVLRSGVSQQVGIYFLHNVSGGVEATFDDSNGGPINVWLSEWSGLANAIPEETNDATALASATVAVGPVTPASADSLILAGTGFVGNVYSSGPTDSFTRRTQTGVGTVFQEVGSKVLAAPAATSTGWTLTVGVNWTAVIAAFGGSVAGGGGAKNLLLTGVG